MSKNVWEGHSDLLCGPPKHGMACHSQIRNMHLQSPAVNIVQSFLHKFHSAFRM